MSDAERTSIGPDDWPLEEGSGDMRDGLRKDIGASLGTPKEHSQGSGGGAAGAGAADDGDESGEPGDDRGQLGTATPGSKGTEQGPR